ncbi:hypothetical protein A2U01_0084930, partial [Trifolium medium]|nr:hypothetical protein [Trifolium medium]
APPVMGGSGRPPSVACWTVVVVYAVR